MSTNQIDDRVKVSMYNVGFGDCFLLRFPHPDGERRVLVDCGSIKGAITGGTKAVVQQLIEDVTDADGTPRIDVVVATHRHRDHVSGFSEKLWTTVEVKEVWLPWTEDPDDPTAWRILNEMAGFASALEQQRDLGLSGISEPEQELLEHVIANTLGLSNESAMTALHRGFRNGRSGTPRRFLSRSAQPLDCPALDGIIVHVLGPSRDEAIIREMNPPSDESFLRAAADGAALNDGDKLPFPVVGEVLPQMMVDDELKERLKRMSIEAAVLGAVALEKSVNNTSLMLAFEIGDSVLFFPGDAQWGSWEQNLDDPRTRELLERTSFYKVGHHGSHNATPVTFVEDVLGKADDSHVVAAASVVSHGRFTEIPKHELMEELGHKIGAERVVRSDDPPVDASNSTGISVIAGDGSEAGSGGDGSPEKPIRVDFAIPPQ